MRRRQDLVDEARNLIRSGSPAVALQLLDGAIEREAGDGELLFLRGMANLASANNHSAVQDFDSALELLPDAIPVLFNRALAHHRMEDVVKARADFERVSTLAPDSIEAIANTGVLYAKEEMYVEAERFLRRAVALAPGNAALVRSLANALRGAGQLSESLRMHERGRRLSPGDPAAITDHALALMSAGDFEQARALYSLALELDAADQTALAGLYMSANEMAAHGECDKLMDYDHLLGLDNATSDAALNLSMIRELILADGSLVWEPIGRSTRIGQQSPKLDIGRRSEFASLGRFIEARVAARIAAVGGNADLADHPWLRALPRRWGIQAWSTVLYEGGQQEPHIHPAGWMSGVIYIDAGDGAGADNGALCFGTPPRILPLKAAPRERVLIPAAGRMVTFPSYFFHHTTPYRGDRPRISIAFDVLPERGSP